MATITAMRSAALKKKEKYKAGQFATVNEALQEPCTNAALELFCLTFS